MNVTKNKPSILMRAGVLGLFITLLSGAAYAQVDSILSDRANGFSMGAIAGLGRSVYAGIVGVEVTSPAFLKNRLAVRVRGGFDWIETYDLQGYQIDSHPSVGGSIIYRSFVAQRARFYVEIGTFVLFPSNEISNRVYATGYSGTTGFEFFNRPESGVTLSYFFGGGLAIHDTNMDEAGSQDYFGEDFIFTNGLRVYF